MPEFIRDGRVYYNPVEFALYRIGGLWKMPILWRLNDKTMRFSEIKKSLPKISDKILTMQLRELETYALITRKVYAEVPPRVEYSITSRGRDVIPIINELRNYGLKVMKEEGISH